MVQRVKNLILVAHRQRLGFDSIPGLENFHICRNLILCITNCKEKRKSFNFQCRKKWVRELAEVDRKEETPSALSPQEFISGAAAGLRDRTQQNGF